MTDEEMRKQAEWIIEQAKTYEAFADDSLLALITATLQYQTMQNDRIIEKLNNIEAFTGRATYFLEYGVRVKDGVKVYNHSDEPLYTRNK